MKKYSQFLNKYFIKISFIFFAVIFAISPNFFYYPHSKNNAAAIEPTKVTYAKASKDCALYKDQSLADTISNIYFYIPETYFVSIISKISEDAFKVLYGSFTGYCKTADLTIANFTPTNCTLTGISFDISADAGTQIWSTPSDQNGRVLSTISADTKSVEYIASTVGEIPIGGSSNIWYYARFTPASNTTAVYEGYVYSEATTNLTHIPKNLETNNEIVADPKPNSVNLNTSLKIVFIILICLPFLVLFVISLVKAKKQFKKAPVKEEVTAMPKSEPTKKLTGSYVKKRPKKQPIHEETDDTIEIVFPEYNFVDDDDLL